MTHVSDFLGKRFPEDLPSTLNGLYVLAASFGHEGDTQGYLEWIRDLSEACLRDEADGNSHPIHDIVVEEEARATHVIDEDCRCRECVGEYRCNQALRQQYRDERREDERLECQLNELPY